MKYINFLILTILIITSSCSRDLSNFTYTSDSTLNLTLEGKIIATRPVIIKNTDKLHDNKTGILSGGLAGFAGGNALGGGSGHTAMIIGGSLAGAFLGSVIESNLGRADGIEYIVEVDRSKISSDYYEGSALMRDALASAKTTGLITIIQSKDNILNQGQDVYIILSSKRARVISK